MAVVVLLGACSGSETAKSESDRNGAGNDARVESETVSSVEWPPVAPTGTPLPGSLAKRMERLGNRAERPISGKAPPLSFRRASEDSEFAAAILDDGSVREIRVFRKHPQLASVEVISKGSGVRSLKFIFRSGQVIETSTDRNLDLFGASSADLLELAEPGPKPE